MITQVRLKELLHYEPETGVFTWLERTSNRVKVGESAGRIDSKGYWRISLDGSCYRAHRLAWLYMRGKWPKLEIDHRNGGRTDNSWRNLRSGTRHENSQNMARRSDNIHGVTGVSFVPKRNKWVAQLTAYGERVFHGYFPNKEAARAAYLAAKLKFHHFNPAERGGVHHAG